MNRLLKLEFRRLFRRPSTYVCFAVLAAMIFLSALISYVVFASDTSGKAVKPGAIAELVTAVSSGSAYLILGIFIPMFVCEDYQEGTIKNIYAKGYSRTQVFFAKYITSLFFGIAGVLIQMLLSFLLTLAFFGNMGQGSGSVAGALIAQIVVMIGFISLFFTLSIILRKTGGAIALSIVSPLVMTLLCTLGDTFLAERKIDFRISAYWLNGLLSNVSKLQPTSGNLTAAFVVSIVYIGIAILVGLLLNRKQEL